jgi:hypothetical protein
MTTKEKIEVMHKRKLEEVINWKQQAKGEGK